MDDDSSFKFYIALVAVTIVLLTAIVTIGIGIHLGEVERTKRMEVCLGDSPEITDAKLRCLAAQKGEKYVVSDSR